MSRRLQVILASAAVAALSAAGATAYARAQPKPEPKKVEREVRIIRDGDQVVRIEKDGDSVVQIVGDEGGDGLRVERDGKRVIIHRGHGDPAAMQREHREHLKVMLQLRPNQEAALDAYLAAMKPQDRMIRTDGEARPKTTPERLARMEQRMNEREAAQKTRIEATRRFYAQLDASQKRVFDEMPMMMGPMEFDGPMHNVRFMRHLEPPHMIFPPDHVRPPAPPRTPTPPTPPSL